MYDYIGDKRIRSLTTADCQRMYNLLKNNGRKIKTWCANEAINIDHVLKVTSGINDGITNIYIKLNLKNLI